MNFRWTCQIASSMKSGSQLTTLGKQPEHEAFQICGPILCETLSVPMNCHRGVQVDVPDCFLGEERVPAGPD